MELAATLYGEGRRTLLMLQPIGEERKGVLRPLSRLARVLARSDWQVLLFDYAGTGDSPGAFEDLTWQTLLGNAKDALSQLLGSGQTATAHVLGVRLAARLGLELAQANPAGVTRLVLWEPVMDAARWWRESKRRSRFRLGDAGQSPNDIDGYVYGQAMVASLENMATPAPSCPCEVGIVTVSNRPSPSPAMQQLADSLAAPLETIVQPPFWLETDVVKTEDLFAATLTALGEGPGLTAGKERLR